MKWILAIFSSGNEVALLHRIHGVRRFTAVFCAAVLVALVFPLALAAQTGVLSSLDPNQLNTALKSGGTVTFAIDGTIVLTNTITISNTVILDGTNHLITVSGGSAVQLFKILPSGQLTLRHLTLANGLDNGNALLFLGTASAYGGAIYTQGNLDVENCVFTNNSVISPGYDFYDGKSTYGGAIYNAGSLTISNSLFANNSAVGGSGDAEHVSSAGSGFGGAIYNAGGSLSLGNDIFSNNLATGGTGIPVFGGGHAGNGYGGAIVSAGGVTAATSIQVLSNTVSGGEASSFNMGGPVSCGSACGGAFYVSGGTVAITNSSFLGNSAWGADRNASTGIVTPGQSQGGSIFNSGSTLLSQCVLTGNSATGGECNESSLAGGVGQGGAVYNAGSIKLFESTISFNTAMGGAREYVGGGAGDGQAGAIYNEGSAQIFSSTISDNIGAGGGFYAYAYALGNGWGGAIFNAGLVQLSNTLLSNNTTTGPNGFGEAIYNTGAFLADTNSVVAPNSPGTPPLDYDWQINGTNITGATTSTFNLTNVQFNNSATYDLLISNATGLVAAFDEILNLPLTNAPSFVFQPASQVVDMASTVSMEVAAVGFPAPTYQWLWDGTNLPGATSSLLILTNAQPYQSGSYTVIATNLNGSSSSQPAVLTVAGPLLLTGINLANAGF
ncbi:MAG TPA: immunoglobulin domain-containing protein [Candidatus Saccharimonadales bacterium]|nr:immunoglobulin domain-containing protein [Candidatus Saccharimonadales bacterium]